MIYNRSDSFLLYKKSWISPFSSDHIGRVSHSAALGQASAPLSRQATTAMEFSVTSSISPTEYSSGLRLSL